MATAKARATPAPAVRGGWKRRWAKRLAIAFVILLVVPILEVGCVRFVNPPATPLMGIRWLQDRLGGEAHPRVMYHWLPWNELPLAYLKSAWVSEDQRFFQHHGFDWTEMHAAIERAKRTGGEPRGSSTITMQCARSTFLWQGHSYVRKGLEAYYTVWMELLLSKRRIFELYANVVEMGPGVYGVEAASQYHYGIPAKRLDAEQAAFLAALLPAPRKWNPRAPSPRLRARQERILRELPLLHWPG